MVSVKIITSVFGIICFIAYANCQDLDISNEALHISDDDVDESLVDQVSWEAGDSIEEEKEGGVLVDEDDLKAQLEAQKIEIENLWKKSKCSIDLIDKVHETFGTLQKTTADLKKCSSRYQYMKRKERRCRNDLKKASTQEKKPSTKTRLTETMNRLSKEIKDMKSQMQKDAQDQRKMMRELQASRRDVKSLSNKLSRRNGRQKKKVASTQRNTPKKVAKPSITTSNRAVRKQ